MIMLKLDLNLYIKQNREHYTIRLVEDYGSMIPDAKKATEVKGPKILTPEQMLQGLPIALGQLKAGNNSENLLNRIRQIVYFLYQSKKKKKKYTIT